MVDPGSWDPLYGGGENLSGGLRPQVLHRIDDDNVVSVSGYNFEFPFPTGATTLAMML